MSHPDDDIPGRDLLNVEPRWSYTVFLSSVSRYLSVKSELGEPDFMYAYAREILLRYAAWMLDHEKPYFDQIEKLEYPNETWAAQEFRKANVLRLAATHADEPMRSALLQRGDEFSEPRWHDLMGFPSRHSARAVALLLIEGCRDACLSRRATPSALPLAQPAGFGTPEHFVPQKEKALSRIRTLRGCVMILLKLIDVRNLSKLRLRGHLNF